MRTTRKKHPYEVGGHRNRVQHWSGLGHLRHGIAGMAVGSRGEAKASYNGVVQREDGLDRITRDPAIMAGKPCIRGMRVTVGTLVGLVAAGHSEAEILAAYPYLDSEDVRQALAYSAWRVEEIELPLPAA